jgi:hypothetical protein
MTCVHPRAGSRLAVTTAVLAIALLVARQVCADPRTDYVLHCQGCHGPDGGGAPGAVPSFRHHVAKFVTVSGGREYLIRVPGTSQSELDDARVAALLNWILREFSPAEVPPDFAPFSAEEVTRHRRPPLIDVVGTRRTLVQAIAERQR